MTPSTANALARGFSPARQASEHALVGLAGSVLSGRFRYWQGEGGRRYLFSVFPIGCRDLLDDVPRFENAVILVVTRDAVGERRVLFADDTGPLPDLVYASTRLRDAVATGANEIHVHLLAETAADRATALRDLDEI